MPDPIPTPGVRVGQVWERTKPKSGRGLTRFEVTGWGLNDVYLLLLDGHGKPLGGDRSTPRLTFEQRYRLVSEGGAPDA